jgi:LytS/YehU family sensor histidine kinase
MSYETVLEYASLTSELKYIENMIELYKLRINNPECIKVYLPLHYPNLKIAPLLFIPFIENAFKYAVFKDENAGFSLHFDVQNSVISFTISNYYNVEITHQRNKQGGTGIENVKKRLAIIYPNKHWLQIKNNDGRFIVELKIDTLDN